MMHGISTSTAGAGSGMGKHLLAPVLGILHPPQQCTCITARLRRGGCLGAGTGKTLLARAVANRTDACFIRVIGSELVQKYVGEGARMVRELFQMARSKKACLIFFDEVTPDVVLRS